MTPRTEMSQRTDTTASPRLAPAYALQEQSVGIEHSRRPSCRACGNAPLQTFLSLGPQPLANAFPRSPEAFAGERTYPLDVAFCPDCALVQIVDVIDPAVLFRDYIYVTGTSATMAEHFGRYAATVTELLGLGAGDLVVEVASNDGSLLKHFRARGIQTLGIEPASNIAAMARSAGIDTIDDFFDHETAKRVRATRGAAKAVMGNNVLAHVNEPVDFLRGCAALIDESGLVVVEVPYLGEMLDKLEYDTVYHEHISYFSITALLRLLSTAGLSVVRLEHFPVHGGTVRVYAGLSSRHGGHCRAALELADAERAKGMTDRRVYERFAEGVKANRLAIRALLEGLRLDGKTVVAYGASAKGNTLLNYCDVDTSLLPYVVDKSPLKLGTYTPGTHLPVLPVETLLEKQPDYVLILAWNFAEEIMAQQAEYRARGGRFIIPVPSPKVV